jgi:two-component system OmpR family sensor kinase
LAPEAAGSELEAPDQPLSLEEVSLGEFGHDIAQGLVLLAERHSVGLSIDVSTQDTPVVADLALLQRVLPNLLTNAIKATPHGGRVKLIIAQRSGFVRVDVQDGGRASNRRHRRGSWNQHSTGKPPLGAELNGEDSVS